MGALHCNYSQAGNHSCKITCVNIENSHQTIIKPQMSPSNSWDADMQILWIQISDPTFSTRVHWKKCVSLNLRNMLMINKFYICTAFVPSA